MGATPVQVRGQVLSRRRVGAYHALTIAAPGIADRFRPGQFVAIAVGEDGDQGTSVASPMLLRRAFSIYQAGAEHGGTVEIVFAVHGGGTAWLAGRRSRDPLDVVGPLGHPFPMPREPARCVLVGGGYGSAPLFALATRLRERGCRIDFVLGAATADRVFGALSAQRAGDTATVTTEDGSLGVPGMVTDVLPRVIDGGADGGADVVYACGPMSMLRAVTAVATEAGIPAQVAVEEEMACGIGVCMTCVLPVIGDDDITRMVRSCVDGPVFRGDRVRWNDIGTVPSDTLGASLGGGP